MPRILRLLTPRTLMPLLAPALLAAVLAACDFEARGVDEEQPSDPNALAPASATTEQTVDSKAKTKQGQQKNGKSRAAGDAGAPDAGRD